MTNKKNPLNLNALQLRTLTVLQALAHVPQASQPGPGEGEVTIVGFPQQHADHFHVGEAVVMGKDATGIFNQTVWSALDRKGVARADWPNTITLTPVGLAYDTGLAGEVLHRSGH